MKKFAFPSAVVFFVIFLFSACNITSENFWSGDCNVNGRFSGLADFTADDTLGCKDKYEVLMLTDVHIGAKFYKDEYKQKFFSWLDNYDFSDVKFACGLGDFADDAKDSQMKEYAQIASKIEEKGIRVFNVIGNHDLFLYDGYETFAKYCYPHTSYYRFETERLVWYGLDNGSGLLGGKQFASLESAMLKEKKTPVILAHIPLYNEGEWHGAFSFCMRDTTERNKLISLFNDKSVPAYFCGHFHPGGTDKFGSVFQYNLRSFGEFGVWYIIEVDESGDAPSFKLIEISQ